MLHFHFNCADLFNFNSLEKQVAFSTLIMQIDLDLNRFYNPLWHIYVPFEEEHIAFSSLHRSTQIYTSSNKILLS